MAGDNTKAAGGITVVAADLETVENALNDLDLGEDTVEELEDLVAADAELDDEDVRALEASSAREEAYREQDGGVDVDASKVAAKKEAKATKKPKAATGTPRAPRIDLASIPGETFVLAGDVSKMKPDEIEACKKATIAARPAQKKIGEKFDNLFQALHGGKLPSTYVVQAFKNLDENKSITSSDIAAMFKGTYSAGTAMSQTGQIMNLFEAVGIAKREKSALTLNADSNVAARLRQLIKEAKSAA